jgi:5'(3')-deoxyribonucleotidase
METQSNQTNQEPESIPNRIIYVDMDGTLCDFEGHFQKISNLNIKSVSDDELWKTIESYGKDKFFSELPWLSGSRDMWNFATQNFLHVKILSALGKSDIVDNQTTQGKKSWLNKHLPDLREDDIILVQNKHKKRHYSKKGDIMIDDTYIVIQEWIKKGGVGILHKTSIDTINQLRRYV